MEKQGDALFCTLEPQSRKLSLARITVKQAHVNALYRQALSRHQLHVQARGFARGSTPVAYLELTYKAYILEHLKEFLLNHCVINFLCQELTRQHVVVVGDPTLFQVSLTPDRDAEFVFRCSQLPITVEQDWRRINFKIPGRRNYKDLDRQVDLFIREESSLEAKAARAAPATVGDWICFSIMVVDHESHVPLFETADEHELLWLKIGREDTDREAQLLFCGKSVGDAFISASNYLQRYFSKQLDTDYAFLVTIRSIVPVAYFSFDALRRHFSLTPRDSINRELVSVFSTRNDITLRRELVEATFRAIFKKIPIWVPEELVRHQEEYLLREVQRTPDYPVYRLQKDFRAKISALAEKQLREALMVDHIGQREVIMADDADVESYLSMLQRPRTKEFIYFDLPVTQVNGQEQPLPLGIVKQACLREKVLNSVITALTRH
ncbi:MAG: hypothetical protein M1549_02210 [Candidatus Dependentiae bacterium]|nr:hypothetical protein [Candidatus Dependentiae bacterium]